MKFENQNVELLTKMNLRLKLWNVTAMPEILALFCILRETNAVRMNTKNAMFFRKNDVIMFRKKDKSHVRKEH